MIIPHARRGYFRREALSHRRTARPFRSFHPEGARDHSLACTGLTGRMQAWAAGSSRSYKKPDCQLLQ